MIITDPTWYLQDDYVVLDFEGTNLDKGDARNPDNRVILACWRAVKGQQVTDKYVRGGIYDLKELLDDIANAKFLVAQNAKFELQWLARAGLDLRSVVIYDTMIADYVVASNRNWALDLDSIALRLGHPTKDHLIKKLMRAGVCPSDMPFSLVLKYCAQDVDTTHKVMLDQRQRLLQDGLLAVFLTRCLLTPVLADIEMRGAYLNKDAVLEEYNTQLRRLIELDQEVNRQTGGINMNSPKQKAEFLYDVLGFAELTNRQGKPIRTPGGSRITKIDQVLQLKTRTKKQKEFIELLKVYSKVDSRISKNLAFFKGVVDERNGLFYGNFNQTVTATGRLSSTGKPILFEQFDKPKSVQFQNMPREYKRLLTARTPGWKVRSADGAQLEFRVAAQQGHDKQAYEDIINGVDVHNFTAETLTGAGQETDRQGAKSHTFKPLYGGQSGTDAERRYYEAFRNKYPGIVNRQQQWINEALLTQKVVMDWGLVYYYPGTKVTRSGYIENTSSICNYPVQGLATAEIIPIAMVYMWHYLAPYQTFITNTVHDSVATESPPEEEELFNELVVQSFTHDVYKYLDTVYDIQFDVPLGVGIKHADNWDDTKQELKITPDPMFKFEEAA